MERKGGEEWSGEERKGGIRGDERCSWRGPACCDSWPLADNRKTTGALEVWVLHVSSCSPTWPHILLELRRPGSVRAPHPDRYLKWQIQEFCVADKTILALSTFTLNRDNSNYGLWKKRAFICVVTTVQEGHQVPVLLLNLSIFFSIINNIILLQKSQQSCRAISVVDIYAPAGACVLVSLWGDRGASQRYLSPLLSQSSCLNEYRIKAQRLILNSALFSPRLLWGCQRAECHLIEDALLRIDFVTARGPYPCRVLLQKTSNFSRADVWLETNAPSYLRITAGLYLPGSRLPHS